MFHTIGHAQSSGYGKFSNLQSILSCAFVKKFQVKVQVAKHDRNVREKRTARLTRAQQLNLLSHNWHISEWSYLEIISG